MFSAVWDDVAELLPQIIDKDAAALRSLPSALMEPSFSIAERVSRASIKSTKRSPKLGVWDVPLEVQELAATGVEKGYEVGQELYDEPPTLKKGPLPYVAGSVFRAVNTQHKLQRLQREKDSKGYNLIFEGYLEVGLFGGCADDKLDFTQRSDEFREALRDACEEPEEDALMDAIEAMLGEEFETQTEWFHALAEATGETEYRVKKRVKALADRIKRCDYTDYRNWT